MGYPQELTQDMHRFIKDIYEALKSGSISNPSVRAERARGRFEKRAAAILDGKAVLPPKPTNL